MASGRLLGGQSFDEDGFGQLAADAEAGVADLANDIGMAAQQFDALLFAKTEFSQADPQFRRPGQFLDANHRTRLNAAEGTDGSAGALAF
jgi:hypothetical protein